jgi:2-dehydro-3-deoxygalactonokinase
MVGFRTFMTGELFDVLTRYSILRHTTEQGRGEPGDAFHEGIAAAGAEPLTAAIFRARTRSSLSGLDAKSNTAFLSGALIGTELAALPTDVPVILCGGRSLGPLYAAALGELGTRDVTVVAPEDVERLSVLGHMVLLDRILA